jgi:hypothetical protein
VVERHAEFAGVGAGRAVAAADQVDEIVTAVDRVKELAPGDGDVIAPIGDVDGAVGSVDDGAMIDPDMMRAVLERDAVAVAPPERQVAQDDVAV